LGQQQFARIKNHGDFVLVLFGFLFAQQVIANRKNAFDRRDQFVGDVRGEKVQQLVLFVGLLQIVGGGGVSDRQNLAFFVIEKHVLVRQ